MKRIEIHKKEIIVVFRIDPDPGGNREDVNPGRGSINSQGEEKSLQECTGRYFTVVGESIFALCVRSMDGPEFSGRSV